MPSLEQYKVVRQHNQMKQTSDSWSILRVVAYSTPHAIKLATAHWKFHDRMVAANTHVKSATLVNSRPGVMEWEKGEWYE